MLKKAIISGILIIFLTQIVNAQKEVFNYDEAKTGSYTLPPLLTACNDATIKNTHEWEQQRRPELLKLFQENIYGRVPVAPAGMHAVLLKEDHHALGGIAISKQIRLYFTSKNKLPYMDILLYLPAQAPGPVPIFAGLNFRGNQNVNTDTAIIKSEKLPVVLAHIKYDSSDVKRGTRSKRWVAELLIKNGFGLATAFSGDLEPDFAQGWKTGVRTSLQETLSIHQSEWGAVSAWAWGLSRIMDYLETDVDVDAKRVIVIGHSRLGKAALWAAANDQRFAAAVSNNSGEAGAALARRWFGETINSINVHFPYWFIDRYKTFNNHPEALPVDQHMLLSLIAPRPLYVASATNDRWADPHGEFLSAVAAGPVYKLYGKTGLGTDKMPAPDSSIGNTIRYHIRTGNHNITAFDWQQYIRFAHQTLTVTTRK